MPFSTRLRDWLRPRSAAVQPPAQPATTDRFRTMAEQFTARLKDWDHAAPPPAGARVGVLVAPWISTGVPFFTMECALAMAQSGLQVTLLWDGCEIAGNVPNKKHLEVIESIFPLLPPWITRVDISASTPRLADQDAEHARRVVYENAVRSARGEMNVAEFFAAHPGSEADTEQHFGRVRETLSARKFDWLLIPGGIFGVSAVYVEIARELAIPFSTFDSGPGRLRLVHDGVAAHLADLPRAFDIISAGITWEKLDTAIQQANAEIDLRALGQDPRKLQVTPATSGPERCDILIPLNIRWDSAALSRQRLFASVEESISSILEWVSDKPAVTVCIRRHPSERREHMRGSDDWSTLANAFAHLGDRVRWIGPADPVNTYDLIRAASVVLPHTSTVGIEAALLGKPVVLSTEVYYKHFPFVWSPASRADFFHLLDQALKKELTVSPSAKREAALAYFLTQRCALLLTDFTPQNDDYPKWISRPPSQLWADPENADFLLALGSRQPLTAIRARRILNC